MRYKILWFFAVAMAAWGQLTPPPSSGGLPAGTVVSGPNISFPGNVTILNTLLGSEISTPSTPVTGVSALYAKSGKWCSLSSAGLENCIVQPKAGSATLNSTTGVVITHGLGDTNYAVHVTPITATPGSAGEISYTKTATTVTIYNSGMAGLAADYIIVRYN